MMDGVGVRSQVGEKERERQRGAWTGTVAYMVTEKCQRMSEEPGKGDSWHPNSSHCPAYWRSY
jgi:hypothetical protein